MSGKVNSKRKGNGFERKVVNLFEHILGVEFRRTFGSGAHKKNYAQAYELGDIRPEDPDNFDLFRFVVECKSYKEIPYHQIMAGECQLLDDWLKQLMGDLEKRMAVSTWEVFPLLIFTANRRPTFFVTLGKLSQYMSADTLMKYKRKWIISEIGELHQIVRKTALNRPMGGES